MKTGATVTSVDRVLDILEAFGSVRKPMSLTSLADRTGIPKSSCHAIVGTLLSRGYAYALTRPRAVYPTRRLLDVAQHLGAHDPLLDRVMPALEKLRDATRETVVLARRHDGAAVFLQVLEGPQAIRYGATTGERRPLPLGAVGRALLGAQKEAELRDDVARLGLSTPQQAQDLVDAVLSSRRRGWFESDGEAAPDVCAVASPFQAMGQTLAVAVAGPRQRMQARLQSHVQALLATTGQLGASARVFHHTDGVAR